ncbi:hydroxyproline O-galactosyltransferase GALT2-like, partial [Asparagus officinalis]|uniref:hydroxyproline O-galactosyltransferase GALT2-like n=1 Tax=Asparagus officinalis TaxID=4686 RepID=UPI00098E813D
MKRGRSVEGVRRGKLYHLILAGAALYLIFISLKFRRFIEISTSLTISDDDPEPTFTGLHSSPDPQNPNPVLSFKIKPLQYRYGRILGGAAAAAGNLTELERMADEAWTLGTRAWDEVEDLQDPVTTTGDVDLNLNQNTSVIQPSSEACPTSVSMSGKDAAAAGGGG